MAMSPTPYVNDDGDVWIERGVAPWPVIRHWGRIMAIELGGDLSEYVGIEFDVRVSDEHEYSHGDDDGCADSRDTTIKAPGFVACCRTITAHHFRAVERG
jgi:hypothetical protein